MNEYEGYAIATMVAYFDATYSVRRGETVVHKGTVKGPFDSREDARVSAELAARGWIDRYAKAAGTRQRAGKR